MKASYNKENSNLYYKCYHCGFHCIPVWTDKKTSDKKWNWNGDEEKPTITPSVKHFHNGMPEEDGYAAVPPFCCHYVITDGIINYCSDCTHDKAGQSLELRDVER